MNPLDKKKNLYIVLISVHGLIRSRDLELGRDADTGGQSKYVVELAKALARHSDVARVDLLTRWISDPKVSDDYAVFEEKISEQCAIIRLKCGPKRYLRKEALWPYLDTFSDQALAYFRSIGRTPDILHSHYADAGYIGSRLSAILCLPLVFTGHSLGRVKLKRILEQGIKKDAIETTYAISQRIEAEEMTLDYASLVVASTSQEIEEQYKIYDNYEPDTMVIIPPGVNLDRFYPPSSKKPDPAYVREINKFLADPAKPIIYALSRADYRKNIKSLVMAYGTNPELQKKANLLVMAGTRDDISQMEPGTRQVLEEILLLIDKYDLYGKVAIPKTHRPEDIPQIFRWIYRKKGVFINPALTEPFGLTLIEAAASGIPIVATSDGGPREITHYCKNGILVNPLDTKEISRALLSILSDPGKWQQFSQNGISGVHKYFSWTGHVDTYVAKIKETISKMSLKKAAQQRSFMLQRSRMPQIRKMIISDIDNTLIGDNDALWKLENLLSRTSDKIGFGIATGRSLESTLQVLAQHHISMPDLLITSTGTEIYYAPNLTQDISWSNQLNYKWDSERIKEVMKKIPGFVLQKKKSEQGRYKISYDIDTKKAPRIQELRMILRNTGLHVNLVFSHNAYLDILPVRASKGSAIRRFAINWGLPFHSILVVGDSGNDEWMLKGDTLGVVVGNYSPELEKLRGKPLIYFARGRFANGIIEGIYYYNFLEAGGD